MGNVWYIINVEKNILIWMWDYFFEMPPERKVKTSWPGLGQIFGRGDVWDLGGRFDMELEISLQTATVDKRWERCSLNCCKHWGKEWGIWDLWCRKWLFFRGLKSRLHTIWQCCSTASSQHLHYNIFSKGWDSYVAWALQVPVCAILYLSYERSVWVILHSLWCWKS